MASFVLPHGASELDDGTVIFPRGVVIPSSVPADYYEDPQDDRRWIRLYPECKNLKRDHKFRCERGQIITIPYCLKHLLKVNPKHCRDACSDPDKRPDCRGA